ncbi:MAG: CBS domain-containing protein [Phycisphaerales bacterium]
MGTTNVHSAPSPEERRALMRSVLDDIAVLEEMLDRGLFETGARRVGAEQELVFVDRHWGPASIGPEVLAKMDDPRATTEIGRFNAEFNSTPQDFTGGCLRAIGDELRELGDAAERAASEMGGRVVLTGILPTLSQSDLGLENLSPKPRYKLLNDVITELRAGRYEVRIKGVDELTFQHDSVLVEALNTSFQLHWQTEPEKFALEYNIAQAVTGPMLAACCNSPVLFGKRLWCETRIAIFEQIVDTRREGGPAERDTLSRVRFGEAWVKQSVLEIFKADIARFRILFGPEESEDARAELDAGRIPKLRSLQTHNGTIYRWNRPCYGITNGKPHLRIENRVLPSGPTIADEIANAAFWFGLMHEMPRRYPDITERLDFASAKANFIGAARQGLACTVHWVDGVDVSARDLILGELLDAAQAGLERGGVDRADIDESLGILRKRVECQRTGARWMLDSIAKMQGQGTRAVRLAALTAAMAARSRTGAPVSEWDLAEITESGSWKESSLRVGQFMTTDLFTVHEDELIDLAASIMQWERIRHVPVEDDDHKLIGILSYRDLLRLVADPKRSRDDSISVGELMRRDPMTVRADTPTLEAIAVMRENEISCLPVTTADGKLVGLVTEHDFMRLAGRLLEEQLARTEEDPSGG